METTEIATLIQELEDRVERLRALYEQYFMGIERIEPLILRKDIDRRLWMLRREQIRNTGTRFRLQTTIQRYNTYQQYWQRICREIENGTYQRDLGRAAARFGAAAAANTALGRRRQKMFEKGIAKRAERDAARASVAPPASSNPPDSAPASQPSAAASPAGPSAGAVVQPAIPGAPRPPQITLGAEGSGKPVAGAAAAATPAGPPGLPPRPVPKIPGVVLKVPAPLGGGKAVPPPLNPMKAGAAQGATPPAARPAAPPHPPPQPPPRAPPPLPPMRAAAPASPVPQGPPQARPAPSPPAAAAAAAAKPAAPAPTAAAPASDALSEARLRQIYGRYVEAKRQCNESTATTTFDKVAQTLRRSEQQLRAQHQGRRIDFDVVVKDGKPILKPVVKS